MPAPAVEILMSTFNGAAWLDAQLRSILDQSFGDWSLLIRDDGSSDGTIELIEAWRRRHPERIFRIEPDSAANLGALRSFSRLLRNSSAPHVMFADQDDIWLSDKIAVTLRAVCRLESRAGRQQPILAHTDLRIVDANLRVLSESHWRHQGLAPRRDRRFASVLIENTVWGCTAMLNRALVDLIGDIPPASIHHDWWIALVAAAFGRTVPIDRATALYRRHGRNETEISDLAQVSRSGLADLAAARRRLRHLLEESRPRVALFLEHYRDRLSPKHVAAAEAFLRLSDKGPLARRLDILRHGLFFTGLPRTLGLLALV